MSSASLRKRWKSFWDPLEAFEHEQIVVVGQPNCGKSTLFNEVAGYRSVASNFPGATVSYERSHVRIGDDIYDVIDLPGVYSLTSMDNADRETQQYLLTQQVDVIVNVIDASLISRSLELTLQLMELEIPMVLCLNMIDEAERKGIHIDSEKLSERLGIPVVTTVASKGRGVRELFLKALQTARKKPIPRHIRCSRDVEVVIAALNRYLKKTLPNDFPLSTHLLATKLLETDPYFEALLAEGAPGLVSQVDSFKKKLAQSHGKSSDEVISAERHQISMSLFEDVSTISKPAQNWRYRLDNLLMHNLWGYVFLLIILFVFFNVIFKVGAVLEAPLIGWFEGLSSAIATKLGPETLFSRIVVGAVEGIGGGVAIVLPYLFPFLFGLAVLEDVGYLPRVAFLMDSFMHKIGLHGKAIIPGVLGYGCNVPAVMATRILESPRDRLIASLIAAMVPCAARMTIIFGLVGYYLGGIAALLVYLLNFIVIAISGAVLSRLLPEITPGMVMEIPVYQVPRLKIVLLKTWFRLKDFIIIAWPLLIAGSVILVLTQYFQLTDIINRILMPITSILGLPSEVGMTLIFGVLRKELSMLMLIQALGTHDIMSVMSAAQIYTFTIFVVFYIPCVATMGTLHKQVGRKGMWLIVLFTLILAILMGVMARAVGWLVW